MVIHHTDCGMLSLDEQEVNEQIEAETGVRPPFSLEAFSDLDANVKDTIARIEASPFIPSQGRDQRLRLRGRDGSAARSHPVGVRPGRT